MATPPRNDSPFADEAAMATIDRIEMNPKIMLGKPVIRGTRITVEAIVRKISEGMAESDLLNAYPGLTVPDVRAALAYAADTLAHEETILVDPPKKPTG
jgi:uncharacterized protein (DUF433 family)